MTGGEKKSSAVNRQLSTVSRHPRGLTLMEILVVLGVFSLTVMLTSSIFLLSNRAQRRVLTGTAAQADLRFALEAMVREVRSGRIDYDYYEAASGGVSVPTRLLVVRNASNQREEFFLETSPSVCPAGTVQCLAVRLDGGTAQSLTSTGITIDDVVFYISPSVDPFTVDPASGAYKADRQPIVTLLMRARTVAARPDDLVKFTTQTSVAARQYVR